MAVKTAKRTAKRDLATHEDGPAIPAVLLGELRAAAKERYEAQGEANAHNVRGRDIQRRVVNAEAVHGYIIGKVSKRFGLAEGDVVDLERGIVRKAVRPALAKE